MSTETEQVLRQRKIEEDLDLITEAFGGMCVINSMLRARQFIAEKPLPSLKALSKILVKLEQEVGFNPIQPPLDARFIPFMGSLSNAFGLDLSRIYAQKGGIVLENNPYSDKTTVVEPHTRLTIDGPCVISFETPEHKIGHLEFIDDTAVGIGVLSDLIKTGYKAREIFQFTKKSS